MGTVISALVGGAEIIISHPSQLVLAQEGMPIMPETHVDELPSGAIHWDQAKPHMGETRTVCGITVTVMKKREADRDLSQLNHDYSYDITDEPWARLLVGDSSVLGVSIRHSLLRDLTELDKYENQALCVTGKLVPSLSGNSEIVVKSLTDIEIMD